MDINVLHKSWFYKRTTQRNRIPQNDCEAHFGNIQK